MTDLPKKPSVIDILNRMPKSIKYDLSKVNTNYSKMISLFGTKIDNNTIAIDEHSMNNPDIVKDKLIDHIKTHFIAESKKSVLEDVSPVSHIKSKKNSKMVKSVSVKNVRGIETARGIEPGIVTGGDSIGDSRIIMQHVLITDDNFDEVTDTNYACTVNNKVCHFYVEVIGDMITASEIEAFPNTTYMISLVSNNTLTKFNLKEPCPFVKTMLINDLTELTEIDLSVFPNLVDLSILDCPNLTTIKLGPNKFNTLTCFHMKNCPKYQLPNVDENTFKNAKEIMLKNIIATNQTFSRTHKMVNLLLLSLGKFPNVSVINLPYTLIGLTCYKLSEEFKHVELPSMLMAVHMEELKLDKLPLLPVSLKEFSFVNVGVHFKYPCPSEWTINALTESNITELNDLTKFLFRPYLNIPSKPKIPKTISYYDYIEGDITIDVRSFLKESWNNFIIFDTENKRQYPLKMDELRNLNHFQKRLEGINGDIYEVQTALNETNVESYKSFYECNKRMPIVQGDYNPLMKTRQKYVKILGLFMIKTSDYFWTNFPVDGTRLFYLKKTGEKLNSYMSSYLIDDKKARWRAGFELVSMDHCNQRDGEMETVYELVPIVQLPDKHHSLNVSEKRDKLSYNLSTAKKYSAPTVIKYNDAEFLALKEHNKQMGGPLKRRRTSYGGSMLKTQKKRKQ